MASWQRTLYVMWFGQFCLLAGISLVAPFLPLYLAELGVRDPGAQALWSGIIFAINYVAAALFQPVWGELADRHGRKLMALRSTLGIGLAVGLFAVAPNVWWLLVFRILQGTMVGYTVAASALVSAQAPPDRQGYALGFLQTGFLAGTVCGPLLGGVLAHVLGAYRPIFLATTAVCWLAGLLTWTLVEEGPRPAASAGRRKTMAGLAMLRSHPVVLSMVAVAFVANFAAMTVEPTLTLFLGTLQAPAGSLELYAGVVFAVTGVASFLAAPRLGRLGDRIGHSRLIIWCLAIGVGIYLLQGLVTAAWQLAVLRFLLGLVSGGMIPAANAAIAKLIPADQRGRGFGYTMSANFWGNVLGPLTGSAVAAGFGSLRAVFPATAAVMAAGLVWVVAQGLRTKGGQAV